MKDSRNFYANYWGGEDRHIMHWDICWLSTVPGLHQEPTGSCWHRHWRRRKMCIARHDLSHRDDDLMGMCFCTLFEWQQNQVICMLPCWHIHFWRCHCLSRTSSEAIPLSKRWRGWLVSYTKNPKKNDSMARLRVRAWYHWCLTH